MNILIHKRRWYRQAKTHTTYGCITLFKEDIFTMFDRAAKKLDILYWYKKQAHEYKMNKSSRDKE